MKGVSVAQSAMIFTTINEPTEALLEFVKRYPDWNHIVVGDRKTSATWTAPGVQYYSFEEQVRSEYALAQLLPANHYCRKNFGYLAAISAGAPVIFESDDDNAPYRIDLSRLSADVDYPQISGEGWCNVYSLFTKRRVWPRGLPLDRIDAGPGEIRDAGTYRSPVQQFLAAGDPDVDAIYRLTVGEVDHEYEDLSFGLDHGVAVPFNSQSTVWYPEAYAYLYLPSFVSFRMTDIWRSFVAQACLWSDGSHLSYHGAGVWQDRNAHDLMRDFNDEVPGYQRNDEIMTMLTALPLQGSATDKLLTCYEALHRIGIVPDEELPLVHAWIADLHAAGVR